MWKASDNGSQGKTDNINVAKENRQHKSSQSKIYDIKVAKENRQHKSSKGKTEKVGWLFAKNLV